MRRLGKIAFALFIVFGSLQVATGEPGRSIEAVMLMADIATGGQVPWRSLQSEPSREEISSLNLETANESSAVRPGASPNQKGILGG